MRWAQVIAGSILLPVAFGFLFIPSFGSVIWVCLLGNQTMTIEGYHGAMSVLTNCDEQIRSLTHGIIKPLLLWIFVGLTITGTWLLITGLQSRTFTGIRKEA